MGANFFFLEGEEGSLFSVMHSPASVVDECGAVLFVQPFAEELNKCRRMMSLQGRALADRGWRTLVVDPYGCGDSSGDFGDASWELWRHDYLAAHRWLANMTQGPVKLLGVRLGALMCVELSRELTTLSQILLWQPIALGKAALNDFLRIRLVGEMMLDGSSGSVSMGQLRERLHNEGCEVAGYALTARLAQEIQHRELDPLDPPRCPVDWFEVNRTGGDGSALSESDVVTGWRANGCDVRYHLVNGPGFWSTTEIVDCPSLIEASGEALRERARFE